MRLYLATDLTKAQPPKTPSAAPTAAPSTGAASPPSAGGPDVEYDYWYPSAGQTTPPGTGWQPLEGSNGYKRPKGMGSGMSPTPAETATPAPVSPTAKTEPQLVLDPQATSAKTPTMPDTSAADAKIKAWLNSPEGKKKLATLTPNTSPTGPQFPTKQAPPQAGPQSPTGPQFPSKTKQPPGSVDSAAEYWWEQQAAKQGAVPQAASTPSSGFDAQAMSTIHSNTDADTHKKLAEVHAQQGNKEHADWHAQQAEAKKKTAQPKSSDSASESKQQQFDEPQKKKHTVDDISKMSHKEQAGGLASSIQSHIDNNQELSPKQKQIAEALLSAAQFHANADELSPEAKKELSQLSSIARKHGLHKPYKSAQDYETLDGASDAPQGSTDWLAKFHEGRARGQGLAASSGSAYAAGHVGSQMGNYVSTEAVTQGHRLLTSGTKRSDDPGSSKAEAARAISQAEKDVRLANKQRF